MGFSCATFSVRIVWTLPISDRQEAVYFNPWVPVSLKKD
jgi:hypothetical protein